VIEREIEVEVERFREGERVIERDRDRGQCDLYQPAQLALSALHRGFY
jgi:hypothetical protein